MHNTNARPVSGRKSTRAMLKLGAAAVPFIFGLTTLSSPASAQDECGVPPVGGGTVTCSPSGNPYANGITYPAQVQDLNVVLSDGVDVSTTTAATPGVNVSGIGTSPLSVTGGAASVKTTGAGSDGVDVASLGGPVSATIGTVSTTGNNATGIRALSGTGSSSVYFQSVATTGSGATGVDAGSTGGDVTVSGGSVLTTGGSSPAVYAHSGAGKVKVSTTGDVQAEGPSGAGIIATSSTGDVAVTANNVSTVPLDSADTASGRSAIYASGANATVTSTGTVGMTGQAPVSGPAGAVVVQATGGDATAYVNNVASTGDGSHGVNVLASGNGTVGVTGNIAASGANADAVHVVAGDMATVGIGGNAVLTSQKGNLITADAVNGTTINNAGTLGTSANGFAIVATGGPATINNSGTLSSDVLLTPGNDTLNNSGTFVVTSNPTFGAGNDVFNNSGVVSVAPGQAATTVGLETFNNSGIVDMRNAATGDTLTIPGTFAGSGSSQLGLDANLGTGASDVLLLGGAASGHTSIQLSRIGTQALFDPGGVLVQAGAASPADAFTLGSTGSTSIGLVRYQLRYDPANYSYALVGGPSDTAMRTLDYASGVRSIWLKSADAVSSQLRARRDQLWANGAGADSGKFWVQMYGSVEDRDHNGSYTAFGVTRPVDTGYRQDYFGGQLGFDFGGGSGDRGGFAFGVTGGYTNSQLHFNNVADRLMLNAVNGGIYGSYSSGNLFINGLAKYDYYWADANNQTAGFTQSLKGHSYGGRLEAGVRFGGDGFFVEPAVSVSYLKSHLDDFTYLGTSVNFHPDEGLRGRAGARVGTVFDMFGSKASAYLGGNYVHEFKGKDKVTFASGGQTLSYTNARLGDYGEAKLGVEVGGSNRVSGFIEGTYERSFKRDDTRRPDLEGVTGRAGLRIHF